MRLYKNQQNFLYTELHWDDGCLKSVDNNHSFNLKSIDSNRWQRNIQNKDKIKFELFFKSKPLLEPLLKLQWLELCWSLAFYLGTALVNLLNPLLKLLRLELCWSLVIYLGSSLVLVTLIKKWFVPENLFIDLKALRCSRENKPLLQFRDEMTPPRWVYKAETLPMKIHSICSNSTGSLDLSLALDSLTNRWLTNLWRTADWQTFGELLI